MPDKQNGSVGKRNCNLTSREILQDWGVDSQNEGRAPWATIWSANWRRPRRRAGSGPPGTGRPKLRRYGDSSPSSAHRPAPGNRSQLRGEPIANVGRQHLSERMTAKELLAGAGCVSRSGLISHQAERSGLASTVNTSREAGHPSGRAHPSWRPAQTLKQAIDPLHRYHLRRRRGQCRCVWAQGCSCYGSPVSSTTVWALTKMQGLPLHPYL